MRLEWGNVWKVVAIALVLAWLVLVVAPHAKTTSRDCPPSGYIESC